MAESPKVKPESFADKYYVSQEVVPKDVYQRDTQVREELKSIEYKVFKQRNPSAFSKIINFGASTIGRFMQFSINKETEKKLNTTLYLIGYDFDAKALYGFSLFCLAGGFILGILAILLGLVLEGLGLMLLGVLAFFLVQAYPSQELNRRLSKSSSDLVTLILYLVIYMRQTPNLEAAVRFASDNLGGYLSFDLKKLLWDTASRKYVNIKEALDEYSARWIKSSPAFADSLFLVESSVFQKDEETRLELLDEASQRILSGTYESMSSYASSLKEPLNMVYMLGMILPVLGLVLAPMMMAFVSIPDFGLLLAVMYDIGLPLMVYFMIRDKLLTRPAGFAAPDLSMVPGLPKIGTFFVTLGKKKIAVNAIIPAAIVFIIFVIPVIPLLPLLATFSPNQVYVSLLITAGLGLALYVYFKLSVIQLKDTEDELLRIQSAFSAATFQMGSFLSQGYPPESTMLKVGNTMQNTPVADLFNVIVNNIKQLGYSLNQALFDDKNGALRFFPSAMVVATMRVFVESAKKSVQNASAAMIYVSRHLSNLKRIDEQVKNLLDEVTSGMRVEIGLLSPVMAGIVVGMTALIGVVLTSLSNSVNTIQNSIAGGGTGGAASVVPFALGLFNLSGGAIPLYTFQLIISIYLISLDVIIGYAISNITQPGDPIEFRNRVANFLLISIMLYILVAFIVTLVFSSIGGVVIAATHIV